MSLFPNTPDKTFKQFVYDRFSQVGKAFSSPHRLVVLNILCQSEHTVESLARHAGLTVANVSRHLQLLRGVNLVRQRKEGKFVFYSLADEATCRFFTSFRDFAYSRMTEVQTAMAAVAESPTRRSIITLEDLKSRLPDESLLLLDVRPVEEFEHSHLPGAVSIPLDQLSTHIDTLPRDKEIIAYCRGLFCILADQAVNLLTTQGFEARRLDVGLVDWREAGLPVT